MSQIEPSGLSQRADVLVAWESFFAKFYELEEELRVARQSPLAEQQEAEQASEACTTFNPAHVQTGTVS